MIITPKTKVGELLEAYPMLEPVLISMSPAFEKLKNPILRRTVARVATLQQIAVVGGIPVDDIIKRLRKETGQDEGSVEASSSDDQPSVPPEWFDPGKIRYSFNATPIINSGGSPMAEILRKSNVLGRDEIMELHTPFVPAPVIEMLKEKGYLVYTVKGAGDVVSYIAKE